MITTISATGIVGDTLDTEAFFAQRAINLEDFDNAATDRLSQMVNLIDGRIDKYGTVSDEAIAAIENDELGCGFDLEPGNHDSYVKLCMPVDYPDADGVEAFEVYAYVDGHLVTVRLVEEPTS